MHSKEMKIADFFFDRFRDFCCSTPARENYLFQFTFFNSILFTEAFPCFLHKKGILQVRKNYNNLDISTTSFQEALQNARLGEFNKFQLSNLGDWMDREQFANLLRKIVNVCPEKGRINTRYIYIKQSIPNDLKDSLIPLDETGQEIIKKDRYPFYNVAPIDINKVSVNQN